MFLISALRRMLKNFRDVTKSVRNHNSQMIYNYAKWITEQEPRETYGEHRAEISRNFQPRHFDSAMSQSNGKTVIYTDKSFRIVFRQGYYLTIEFSVYGDTDWSEMPISNLFDEDYGNDLLVARYGGAQEFVEIYHRSELEDKPEFDWESTLVEMVEARQAQMRKSAQKREAMKTMTLEEKLRQTRHMTSDMRQSHDEHKNM